MDTDKSTEHMLEETTDRGNTFMVLGTRRAKGRMQPVLFKGSAREANAAADALKQTGWHKLEVWTKDVPAEAEQPKK